MNEIGDSPMKASRKRQTSFDEQAGTLFHKCIGDRVTWVMGSDGKPRVAK